MIWPDTRSHRNSLLLQPHLPPGSSLNTHTLSCPPAFALEAPLPGENSPRHACGHSFRSFTSLLKHHLLNEAYTDHPSKTATFPVPTHLYSGLPSSEHLPISRPTLPSLIRLTLPTSPEHTARGQQRVSAVSSLRFHRCKNRASSIWHTRNTS